MPETEKAATSKTRAIRDWLNRSPLFKSFVAIGNAVGLGFFTNTLVSEITTVSDGIAWHLIPYGVSFYILLGFAFLNYVFYRYLHREFANVENFKDAQFCEAYVRSQLIPEQVEAYKSKIRQGKTEEFAAAMKELKGILK